MNAPSALGLGASLWAFGSLVMFPVGIGRPAWRSDAAANLANLGAHLLYGGVTAFLVDEYGRQSRDTLRDHRVARIARAG